VHGKESKTEAGSASAIGRTSATLSSGARCLSSAPLAGSLALQPKPADWHGCQSIVDLHRNSVQALVKRYNADDPAAVNNRRATNPGSRRPYLSAEQEHALRAALAQPHPDWGLWNGARVARWIAQTTGREHVYRQYGWAVLPRLGLSPQMPPRPHRAVRRAWLNDVLEHSIQHYKLVQISAPAGYGKTTLLAQWAHASRLPVAWLSLGQEDNDLERFLRTNVDELSPVDLEEKAYRSSQTQSSHSLRQ